MRLLITGASGLLGINLALEAAKEHTVFGQVNSHPLSTTAFTVIQADLLAPHAVERLLEQAQPEWVIHCAALANLEACEVDPGLAQKLNSEIPAELAKHVARGGARLLHVSTDAVFDGQRGDYSEEDDPNPIGMYSQTKLEGEKGVASADPSAIIARVNLYGWGLTGKRSLGEFFFNKLSHREPCLGFTDVFFCPLLANDLAHLFVKMLSNQLQGLYHVVSSECLSKFEFGKRIADKFGLDASLIAPSSWKEGGLKAVRAPNLKLRAEKLSYALGEPLPNISTGLDRFYTLYQQGYPQFLQQMAAGHPP